MAKNITITYVAPVAPVEGSAAQICRTFEPNNAAADYPAVAGTYYDTNVPGFGIAEPLESFMAKMVAHPGLVAALRKAIADGTYAFEADEKEALYFGELKPALADQGFTIEIA